MPEKVNEKTKRERGKMRNREKMIKEMRARNIFEYERKKKGGKRNWDREKSAKKRIKMSKK